MKNKNIYIPEVNSGQYIFNGSSSALHNYPKITYWVNF
jgi:hypothetical protein